MHTRGMPLLAAVILTCFPPAIAQDANTKTVFLERRPAFELPPGQQFTIAVENPAEYEFLKSIVEQRQPIATVAACPIGISHIFFEDGTQWQGHRFMRPSDQPGRYTTISFSEWSDYRQAQ